MSENSKQKNSIAWYHPAFLIATWFGSGKIPFAPGTMGSFFTFPLFLASHYLLAFAHSEESFINLYLTFVAVLFVIGNIATNIYMKKTGTQDPGEVVIDEVVGQILVFFAAFIMIAPSLGVFSNLYEGNSGQMAGMEAVHYLLSNPKFMAVYIIAAFPVYLVCFVLFRIFDIFKPWPIKYCDQNMKGGFGVMFDDVFAAVYAILVLYGVIYLVSINIVNSN